MVSALDQSLFDSAESSSGTPRVLRFTCNMTRGMEMYVPEISLDYGVWDQ